MARILRGGKQVIIVVQRCTIHLDDLFEEHVQVELHGHDVVLLRSLTPRLLFLSVKAV